MDVVYMVSALLGFGGERKFESADCFHIRTKLKSGRQIAHCNSVVDLVGKSRQQVHCMHCQCTQAGRPRSRININTSKVAVGICKWSSRSKS